MMVKYICQNCGEASGYHKDYGEYFGENIRESSDCKKFIWSDEDFKKYEEAYNKRKIKRGNN